MHVRFCHYRSCGLLALLMAFLILFGQQDITNIEFAVFLVIKKHHFMYKKNNKMMVTKAFGTLVSKISWKAGIIKLANKLVEYRQNVYDNITIWLLKIPVINQTIILYHIALFYFRYGCEEVGAFIERFMNLSTFAVLLSMFCSRYHIAGYMIIGCLIFIRLDFAVVAMLRFYKKRPEIMYKNFPQLNQVPRRGMWSKVSHAVAEAITNPQVQAVGAAVAGALAWKAMDVHEIHVQKEIAEADRVAEKELHDESLKAEKERHDEALKAEKERHDEALKAEKERHDEALKAEAVERAKDRVEENKRKAFEIMSSAEYSQLSEEQKESISKTAKTGIL